MFVLEAARCLSRFALSTSKWHRSTLCKQLLRQYSTSHSVDIPTPNLITMKLDSGVFKAIFTPELNQLAEMFQRHNYELRIAGGAVRDIIMDITPADIDFATVATPDQIKEVFTDENVRMLNKRGEKHGTITCRLNDKVNYEVTTLRVDVLCDGRHADVEFTTDWQLDANRRDLTVNSMFVGLDGTVYDYFGGLEDVAQRRIAFVDDAVTRIREDFLRILRYFRFYGRLAKEPNAHEADTLRAIADNVDGLKSISGERLWMELKRIVVGRFAPDLVTAMHDCGLMAYLGLPESPNCDAFRRVYNTAADGETPQPMTLISALLETAADLEVFHTRMKLSNQERFIGEFILMHRDSSRKLAAGDRVLFRKHCQDLLLDELRANPRDNEQLGRQRVYELLRYLAEVELLDALQHWPLPTFPVDGYAVASAGVRKGKGMRVALDYLFGLWKDSNYQLTKEELLLRLPDHEQFPFEDHRPPHKKRKKSPTT